MTKTENFDFRPEINYNLNDNAQLVEVNQNNSQTIEYKFQSISNLDQISIKRDFYNNRISVIYIRIMKN